MKNHPLILVVVFSGLLFSSCSRSRDYSVPSPISVNGTAIQVRSDSKFTQQLDVVSLKAAPGGERVLRAVGQMVAVANPAGALEGETISWAVLDPAYIQQLGIRLTSNVPAGYAYGVTTINPSYVDQIHPGERVNIFRYGLKQGGTTGSVTALNGHMVIFAIRNGKDWYPGTNCEAEFPLIRRAAVALSPLSMLHEGIRDFVLKESGPGQYQPVQITVLNETLEKVYALGALSPGDHVIERGAILLKPILHQIEASHAQ